MWRGEGAGSCGVAGLAGLDRAAWRASMTLEGVGMGGTGTVVMVVRLPK